MHACVNVRERGYGTSWSQGKANLVIVKKLRVTPLQHGPPLRIGGLMQRACRGVAAVT